MWYYCNFVCLFNFVSLIPKLVTGCFHYFVSSEACQKKDLSSQKKNSGIIRTNDNNPDHNLFGKIYIYRVFDTRCVLITEVAFSPLLQWLLFVSWIHRSSWIVIHRTRLYQLDYVTGPDVSWIQRSILYYG